MEDISLYFHLNKIEIVSLSVLFLIFLIQLYYYRFIYNKPLKVANKRLQDITPDSDAPTVSIIIVAKENSEELKQSLPLMLNQNYPNYEVIVVNIGFTEETDVLIKSLKLQYPNLYETFLPEEPLEKNTDRKKMAITLGIKAAKGEFLLYTEPDVKPYSSKWLQAMMANASYGKDVILGYCRYYKSGGFYNRVARFDNLLYSIKYLFSAISHKPYTGAFRNISYKRNLFFENKGFSSTLNYNHSEEVFLNRIMREDNVSAALQQDSFVSADISTFSKWKSIKLKSYRIKKNFTNFKFYHLIFSVETITRYLFYVLFGLLLWYGITKQQWLVVGVTGLLFLLRLIIQLFTINKLSKYFMAGKFYFSFILLELIQPVYNLYFRITARKKSKRN